MLLPLVRWLFLLLLLVPTPALATITWQANDSGATFQALAEPSGLMDVFVPGDVLYVTTTTGTACQITRNGTSDERPLSLVSGRYTYTITTSDTEDDWSLTCDSDTGSVTFWIGDRHPRLWMYRNATVNFAATGTNNFLYDQADTFDDVGLSLSHYGRSLLGSSGQRVPVYSEDDRWTQSTGWQTLLDAQFCGYQRASGSTAGIAQFTTSGPPGCRATSGVRSPVDDSGLNGMWDNTADQADVRTGSRVLERLALAVVVARKSKEENDTNASTFIDPASVRLRALYASDYETAAKHWALALASYPSGASWDDSSSGWTKNVDLARSENAIALAAAYDWLYEDLDLEQRRTIRERLYDETKDLYADHGGSALPGLADLTGSEPNHTARQLRNGHYIEPAAAIGIGANVLYYEMNDGGTDAAERDDWSDDAHDFFQAHISVINHDGADINGYQYWAQNTEYLMRFIESERLDPDPDSSTSGVQDVEDLYYNPSAWFLNTGEYVLHATVLHDATSTQSDGRRITLADSEIADWTSTTGILARIAAQHAPSSAASLTQRMAWDGHNGWFDNGDDQTLRDTLDILWWDPGVSPTTSLTTTPTHQCFADTGIISVRAGWADNDPQLVFRGGGIHGGHDDPSVGSFELYADGPLVVGDEANFAAKRSALHSTFLVDGNGQHGDFWSFAEATPEVGTGSSNNGRLLTYLDGKGVADDGTPIDVVSFGTDVTQLYRADDADGDRDGNATSLTADWVTNVEDTGRFRQLDELARYVVWIGDPDHGSGSGAVLLYDRFDSTVAIGYNPFRFDWRLTTADRTSGGDRTTCAVDSTVSGGNVYYDYTNGSLTNSARYADAIAGADDIHWLNPGPPTQDFNLFWRPVPVSSCFASYITYATNQVLIMPGYSSPFSGTLQVRNVGPGTVTWTADMLTDSTGSAVVGRAVNRSITAGSGYFVHALFPRVDGGGSAGYAEFLTGVTGGKKYRVNVTGASTAQDYHVSTWFADPSASGTPSVTHSTDTVLAIMAVVAHDDQAATTRYAAQMVDGASLTHAGTQLVRVLDSGSTLEYGSFVTATWGQEVVYGRFHNDGMSSTNALKVELHVPSALYSGSPVVTYNGTTLTNITDYTWNSGTNLFTFLNRQGDGDFRIAFTGAASTTAINSSCDL